MKQSFFKIASFLMAIVVLVSTMSFTVDMHYCGDTLVDAAVFHKATTCGMEMEKSTIKGCSIVKKNCCSGKQLLIKGQHELKTSLDNVTFNQQVVIASFLYTYTCLFKNLKENVASYSIYIPPLVIKQLYKLAQTYLI